jgi:hypothetical protein
MNHLNRETADRLPVLLRAWLRDEPFTIEPDPRQVPTHPVDFVVRTATHALHIVCKGTDQVATLHTAARQLRASVQSRLEVPVLVTPYMSPRARAWALETDVSWADLSGNAEIHAPGLHVHSEGHPNRYTTAGRPYHAFSPRYARVSRVLLVDTQRWWRQVELAAEAGLPQGTVSKVVRRLAEDDLIERDADGAVRARAPSLLLDAWAQHDRFADHDIRRFHAVGRSGPDVLTRLAQRLAATDLTWAATGLAAAWQYTGHADFRLTTIYVDRYPTDLDAFGLRQVDRGENVWLVGPRDEGVFYKRRDQGCWCVHPVQTWLDLLGHPERATEAAADLRAKLLTWRA